MPYCDSLEALIASSLYAMTLEPPVYTLCSLVCRCIVEWINTRQVPNKEFQVQVMSLLLLLADKLTQVDKIYDQFILCKLFYISGNV